MNILELSTAEFVAQFKREIIKVGANSALIKDHLTKEGKTLAEIAATISSYYNALGVKLTPEEVSELEDDLGLGKNSLKVNIRPTREDYRIVSSLYRKYRLFSLNLIIKILKSSKEELELLGQNLKLFT